jgi:hypothetical protein
VGCSGSLCGTRSAKWGSLIFSFLLSYCLLLFFLSFVEKEERRIRTKGTDKTSGTDGTDGTDGLAL